MGNSLRCCIACVLPCGALDVIRIVHLSGHVDEFSRPVSAREVLDAHPGHVLSRPCSAPGAAGVSGRIMIVDPESELKRGGFYFLIPAASVPDKKKSKKKAQKAHNKKPKEDSDGVSKQQPLVQDKYLQDILSEKKAGHSRRRSGRVGVWRPHLESISEDLQLLTRTGPDADPTFFSSGFCECDEGLFWDISEISLFIFLFFGLLSHDLSMGK